MMHLLREQRKFTRSNKLAYSDVSDISFVNVGANCTVNGFPLVYGESFSFEAPIFGAIDKTIYEIIFEDDNDLNNALYVWKTTHFKN